VGPSFLAEMATEQTNPKFGYIPVFCENPVSALHAEAFPLQLAVAVDLILQIQQPSYFTDCATQAKAVTANNIFYAPGHWQIRPQLDFLCFRFFQANKLPSGSKKFEFHCAPLC
jgi:hypothetical protein